MTANKRTPVEQYARQTLAEATRADAAQLLDALWAELSTILFVGIQDGKILQKLTLNNYYVP